VGLFHSPKTLQGLGELEFGKVSSPPKSFVGVSLYNRDALFLQEVMFKKKSDDDPPKLYCLSQEKQRAEEKSDFP